MGGRGERGLRVRREGDERAREVGVADSGSRPWYRRRSLVIALGVLLATSLVGSGLTAKAEAAEGLSINVLGLNLSCPGLTSTVRDADGLTRALASARPGDSITLADGEYRGNFKATARGTADDPITLCGSRNAVLISATDVSASGYALHLDGTEYWRVRGFTIRGGQKGLMADHARHNVFSRLLIEGTGHEALHLRSSSSDNVVRENEIRQTGLFNADFGEGIYVGSAISNWSKYGENGGLGPDRSDRNVIERNVVIDTAAESVDIKEGTTGGTLRNNVFDGRGMRGAWADSWVDLKGDKWTITGNVGRNTIADGFQVHDSTDDAPGSGMDNIFDRNVIEMVGAPGYGINVVHNKDRNTVRCTNVVVGAGKGMSNIPCADGLLALSN